MAEDDEGQSGACGPRIALAALDGMELVRLIEIAGIAGSKLAVHERGDNPPAMVGLPATTLQFGHSAGLSQPGTALSDRMMRSVGSGSGASLKSSQTYGKSRIAFRSVVSALVGSVVTGLMLFRAFVAVSSRCKSRTAGHAIG